MATATAGKKNAFAAAASKQAPKVANPKKSDTIFPITDDGLATDIHEMRRLYGEIKSLETMFDLSKSNLIAFGTDRFVEHLATEGARPKGTMLIAAPNGARVTYIITDRTKGYDVKDDHLGALEAVLGADGAANILVEQTIFSFNPMVMNQDTQPVEGHDPAPVAEVLGERIMGLLEEMRVEGVLSQSQVDNLLEAKTIRTFRPGILDRVTDVVGRDVKRIGNFLAALGSAITRTVKC